MGIKLFTEVHLLTEFLNQLAPDNIYIVQEFIKGYNLCFNVLAKEGEILAYTIQKPRIAGRNEFEPSFGIEFFHDQKIYNSFKKIIQTLNWTGVANIDLRYDEENQEVKILEMNTRFWGTLIGSLLAGINFPYLNCLAGLGKHVPESHYNNTSCIIGKYHYFYAFDRFRIKRKLPKFENSSLKLALKDPLPQVFLLCKKILN